MLPAPPKSLGRLGDVLISALASVQNQSNPLGLGAKRSVCVLLIDGLGYRNLANAGGHASFLNSTDIEKISCYFPATTSTSLTGLATGKTPVETRFVGYQVFDSSIEAPRNLLSGWVDYQAGRSYQSEKTISEIALEQGTEFHVVSLPAYQETGLTGATMHGANFHGEVDLAKRFAVAAELLQQDSPKVVFLYVPELDQLAHQWGCESNKWLRGIEEVDSLVRKLVSTLPRQTGLLVTSDHGVLDVPENCHIYLDETLPKEVFTFVGGDTRGLFLYLANKEEIQSVKNILEASYEEDCWVLTPGDLVASGYWNELSNVQDVLPELILLARKKVALYHRGFAKKKSLLMVGHHGSITNEELTVPLLRYNF